MLKRNCEIKSQLWQSLNYEMNSLNYDIKRLNYERLRSEIKITEIILIWDQNYVKKLKLLDKNSKLWNQVIIMTKLKLR